MNSANPYQVPRSNVDRHGQEEYSTVSAFSVSGRLGRIRYLTYSMGYTLLFLVVISILSGGMAAAGIAPDGGAFMALLGIAYVAMIVFSFMLTIQRAHDFDKSGWWSLLMLVPLVSLIFLFLPGTDGENRYGKKTPPNRNGAVILMVGVLMLAVIGILAAIAIPAYQSYVNKVQAAQQSPLPVPAAQPE